MLQQLYIRNYALIREVRLDFSLGFSVMTGETGAGKSILLGALGLVLGDRADSSMLRDAADKCVVEAFFIAPHLSMHPLLQSLELEGDKEWCIRREVTANGKSRAFLNDTPVNLTQLQSFTSSLVDLHQQFDTLELTETDRQRVLLDAMAGLTEDVQAHQIAYADWRHDLNTLQALESRQMRIKQEQEYDQHILQELRDASFQPEEIESLEEKVRAGDRSEGLTQAIQSVLDRLQGDGENLQQQLRKMQQSLHPFEKTDASIAEWLERMRSVDMEIRELAREMDRASTGFQFDPRALSDMQERLSLGYRLMKKHGAKHSAELIDLLQRLSEKLAASETMEVEIMSLMDRTQKQEQALRKKSAILHAAREAVVGTWSQQVNSLLAKVGMPTARFGISLRETDIGPFGSDECIFLLDANYSGGKGEPQWQPVRKVASGGELSRLMLCIKSLAADKMQLPTLIFDEIDTGISGEAAKQVGLLLRALGADRQVICVTHQPQVAAKGQFHWHVTKSETPQGIETQVILLTPDQRVEALARIIGGESPTSIARQNAAELLGV